MFILCLVLWCVCSANQIALQYLDTGKLPWDMQLDLHNVSVSKWHVCV